jgi:hypothetical protein
VANEANEADKAIVANKANDSDNEANGVLDNQLTELEKLDAANEAIVSNKAGEAGANDATDNNKANEAEANKATDEADESNKDVEKVSKITMHLCCCWQPFSLTKYCAIFLKDEGYFCPIANNNQLGGGAMRFNR